MELHLIRHGSTLANEKKLYCGQMDLPLSDAGVAELESLKKHGIYPLSADLFFTSGMLRAEQTLEIIYGRVGRIRIPDIMEYNFGLFEMKCHEELKERGDYQAWITNEAGDIKCPGGESKKEFAGRVIKGYADVLHNIGTEGISAIISCHGGTIACVMEHLQPNSKDFYGWLPQPGRGYKLIYAEGRFCAYKNL